MRLLSRGPWPSPGSFWPFGVGRALPRAHRLPPCARRKGFSAAAPLVIVSLAMPGKGFDRGSTGQRRTSFRGADLRQDAVLVEGQAGDRAAPRRLVLEKRRAPSGVEGTNEKGNPSADNHDSLRLAPRFSQAGTRRALSTAFLLAPCHRQRRVPHRRVVRADQRTMVAKAEGAGISLHSGDLAGGRLPGVCRSCRRGDRCPRGPLATLGDSQAGQDSPTVAVRSRRRSARKSRHSAAACSSV